MRQDRFDGFDIDSHQARFTGTFDLDAEDIGALELDRVVFFVGSVRVQGAGIKSTDTGDIKRVDMLKVQDVRVAHGDMREQCIQWLLGKGGQQTLEFASRNGLASDEEKAEEEQFQEDRATATLSDVLEMTEADQTPVQTPTPSGPKVAKFDNNSFDGTVAEAEVVGTVYKRERKDKALAKFLEAE